MSKEQPKPIGLFVMLYMMPEVEKNEEWGHVKSIKVQPRVTFVPCIDGNPVDLSSERGHSFHILDRCYTQKECDTKGDVWRGFFSTIDRKPFEVKVTRR